MTREEFLKKSLTFGAGLPFLTSLMSSCGIDEINDPIFETNFSGKVLIIGAGAAGITAAYLLKRNNIDFEIIEASDKYGGRVKRADDFADFPIDLGAEWIHDEPSILAELLSKPSLNESIDFITYNPQTVKAWNDGKLSKRNFVSKFYSEYKFKNTTWFGFFEKYMIPDIAPFIYLNNPVTEIDYSDAQVTVKTSTNQEFQGDKVLVTVPVKIIQNKSIEFIPPLPAEKTQAYDQAIMGDGIKIFIEFKERFYPDMLLFGGLINALFTDSKTYYDAAFRKDSSRNILGLFAIEKDAFTYTSLPDDQAIIDAVLSELDTIFDGRATPNYIKHTIQNWSKEPFIQGAYSNEYEGDRSDAMTKMAQPTDNKIFFAGEALSDENQATVHGAAQTAYAAIAEILKA